MTRNADPAPRRALLRAALPLALVAACGGAQPPAAPAPAGSAAAPAAPPYAVAGLLKEPRMFAPGIVSTEPPEFAVSFEPDGRTMYFNRTSDDRGRMWIYVARWTDGAWKAELAPFSGTHKDIDPFVTHDGRRLYFASTRPRPSRPGATDLDLWYVERADAQAPWGEPRHVDGAPNDPEDIAFSSQTRDGTLYFDAFRGTTRGIFRSDPAPGGGFTAPVALPEHPGSNPLIAPGGSFLLLTATLEGGFGDADLDIVRRRADGTWAPPQNLGPAVNTSLKEFAPGLSPDGRYLFFTSERPGVMPAPAEGRPPGDLYQIEIAVLPAGAG